MYQISDFILNSIRATLDVLNKYDPMGIATTAGEGEYEMEAIDIGNRANISSVHYLTTYIEKVFLFWFEEVLEKEMCQEMAKEIKEKICRMKI